MSPRVVNKDEKMNKIILSAMSVMAQKGFHNSRIEEIAKEAGVGKGTVYEYFDSKESLFEAMIDFNLSEDENFLMTLKSLSFEDRIAEIVEYAFQIKCSARDVHKMFSLHTWAALTNTDNDFLKTKMKSYYDSYLKLAFDFMREAINCSDEELEMKCRFFFAVMDGLFLQTLIYPDLTKSKDLIIKTFIKLFKD